MAILINGERVAGVGTNGKDGVNGKDATINGVNALKLKAIGGLTDKQEGDTYTLDGSGLVSGTRTVNGKPLSADVTLDAAAVGARPNNWMPTAAEVGALPRYVKVIIRATDWMSLSAESEPELGIAYNSQKISVPGVLSDESKQLIMSMPAMASQDYYAAAGVFCARQEEGFLTFNCQNVPTKDITVYVVMQEVTG